MTLRPCTITASGSDFLLTIPSPKAGAGEHTVRIPVTSPALLLRILNDRQRLAATATIGTEASPTQGMIDTFIARHGVTTPVLHKAKAAAAAAGLDFDDLNIFGD